MLEKRNTRKLYNLPEEVLYCKKCTLSNQRPRVTFDEQGLCSACFFSDYKKNKIDWQQREKELVQLCDRYRRSNGDYDVIVPCSGGKDGSFVAHVLKHKYGMNPLTVTWAPNIYTDIGRRNLDAFIDSGFTNILGKPAGDVNRMLAKLSFIHLGDPFQAFIYGQANFPLQIAVAYNIPLIMYGENGEVEYGGDMKNAFKPSRDVTDHNKHYFSNLPPEYWRGYSLSAKDLHPYMAPPINKIREINVTTHFLGYYISWDPQENFYYATEHTNFRPNSERNEGTYSKYASLDDKLDGLHYYLGYIKFGIGRATSDTAHEIRDEKITREEGISLVRKYDGEFPKKYFSDCLDYMDVSEELFYNVIDSWRSDHIWRKTDSGYELKHPIYAEQDDLEVIS